MVIRDESYSWIEVLECESRFSARCFGFVSGLRV